MGNDLYGMMMTLANRGIGKGLGGEGNPESRAVALILTAIDQLATAGQLDRSLRDGIDRAIQEIKDVVEGKVDEGRTQAKESAPQLKIEKGKQDSGEAEEEEEEEE